MSVLPVIILILIVLLLSSPVLSNVNPKYTLGSPTGDYDDMKAEIIREKLQLLFYLLGMEQELEIFFQYAEPLGELICNVTLHIDNLTVQFI